MRKTTPNSCLSPSALCLFFIVIFLSACNVDEKNNPQSNNATTIPDKTDKPTAETIKAEMTDLQIKIETLINSASCTNSKQCGALAMGNKACGGPLYYTPYSTKNTDTTKLFELAEQHQQKNKAFNQLTGAMSDCMMVMQPTFICREERCQK